MHLHKLLSTEGVNIASATVFAYCVVESVAARSEKVSKRLAGLPSPLKATTG